jgi:hypothetical protein
MGPDGGLTWVRPVRLPSRCPEPEPEEEEEEEECWRRGYTLAVVFGRFLERPTATRAKQVEAPQAKHLRGFVLCQRARLDSNQRPTA